MEKWGLYLMSVLYFMAGLNHFWHPGFYTPLIPPYLKTHTHLINVVSGLAEMGLALALLFPATRTWASWGIMAMLIAFIPAHWYMLEKAPFKLGGITMTPFLCWVRLLVLHPALVFWAYWVGRKTF
jgi:uncharacterized membrane protein